MKQEEKTRTTLFRERLAALMQKTGVTQQQLADATGLSQAGISNYLRGVRSLPRAEELLALAQHFSVSMEWLLGGEGPQPGSGAPPAGSATASDDLIQVADKIQEQIVRLRVLVGDQAGVPPRRTRRRKGME